MIQRRFFARSGHAGLTAADSSDNDWGPQYDHTDSGATETPISNKKADKVYIPQDRYSPEILTVP